jgi:hypothetical protein
MYAMLRTYSGKGAPQLYSLLMENKDEVGRILRSVKGLSHYDIVKTEDGCMTVTMCEDKAAADESLSKAKNWLKDHSAQVGNITPTVMEGTVGYHI